MSLFVKVFIFSESHFIQDLVIVIQEAFKAICNRNYIEFANDSSIYDIVQIHHMMDGVHHMMDTFFRQICYITGF